jgi:hypothetical protein
MENRLEGVVDFNKYSDTVEQLIEILQHRLGGLGIQSAIFFGSSTFGANCFTEGTSDLDICAFTDAVHPGAYGEILDEIKKNIPHTFLDKPPVILNDHIAERVEFYLEFPQINADITIMAPGLPRLDQVYETAAHDSLELLFANFYQHSIPFIGELPFEDEIKRDFIPFYSDELRSRRLNILSARIEKNNDRVLDAVSGGRDDILDSVYKSREYFLKWLFIYNRKYPLSLRKHLKYQFDDILHLGNDEVATLQFTRDESLAGSANEYVDLTQQYLGQYKQEQA